MISSSDRGVELCRRLRWKGMFVDTEPDPTVKGTSDGFCWCTHTMNLLGPDAEVADRERCTEDRGCYERM